MKKTRITIRGDTVYEMDPFSKKPRHIIHGVEKYFKGKRDDGEEGEDEEEFYEEEEEERTSPSTRRMQLLKLAGNKKKLVSKSDGLKKDIGIDESNGNREVLDRYKGIIDRKKKSKKSKAKRKVCRCKK